MSISGAIYIRCDPPSASRRWRGFVLIGGTVAKSSLQPTKNINVNIVQDSSKNMWYTYLVKL